jgi:hypothetical protein
LKKNIIVLCPAAFFLTLALLSSPLCAEECSPLQLSLAPSIQLVSQDRIVCGVRLDLFGGDNVAVWGLDTGLVNIAGGSRGLQLAGVNWIAGGGEGASWGMQAAGALNYTNKLIYSGAQIALGMNLNPHSEFTGLQLAAINGGGRITGAQGAFFNMFSDVNGVQLGGVNLADKVNGIQFAAINFAEDMHGIQLALGLNGAGTMQGVQIGLIGNQDDREFTGLQLGLINVVRGHMTGAQIGLFNACDGYLSGFQIGLINLVTGGGGKAMPFFPVINVGWY